MKYRIIKRLALLFILGYLVSGCATKMPLMPDPLPITHLPDWSVADFQLVSSAVFSVQPDTGVSDYIAQVLSNNPDLKSIAATAKAVTYGSNAVGALRWPRADLNISTSREKNALTHEVGNSGSTAMDVSWAVDLWGKLKNEAEAANFSAKQSEAELHQARRILTIQSARSWVGYWGLVHGEKALLKLNTVYSNLRDHYQEIYQQGLGVYALFLDANNNLKRNQTRLFKLQLAKQKLLQSMNVLRGQLPTDEFALPDDNLPLDLLAFNGKIPATALVDRPDIQAAFMELLAFNQSERAAYKGLLPQITLTGSALKSGTSLQKIFDGELIWQLVGGLTQQVFNAGHLKAYAKQKSAESEASWWKFQNTVLEAMLEVEQALATEKSFLLRLAEKQQLRADLSRKQASLEEYFIDGEVPVSDLLQVRAEFIETEFELIELQLEYIENRLDLALALGLPLEKFAHDKALSLKTAVGSQKSTQSINAPDKSEKALITSKVITSFSDPSCTPMAYASFLRPTAVFRLNKSAKG